MKASARKRGATLALLFIFAGALLYAACWLEMKCRTLHINERIRTSHAARASSEKRLESLKTKLSTSENHYGYIYAHAKARESFDEWMGQREAYLQDQKRKEGENVNPRDQR